MPGQIVFGHVSDRIGREWAWAIGCLGFAICFAALIALQAGANPVLLYTMVLAQGFLGYSSTSVLGPIVAEIFEGPHFGAIFGTRCSRPSPAARSARGSPACSTITPATTTWRSGSRWRLRVSALAIFIAAPRKVRLVAGRVEK